VRQRGRELTIVFVESFDQGSHLEVPHLDASRVEGGRQEGQLGMEGYPLDPVGLGLELPPGRSTIQFSIPAMISWEERPD
jgi:hypothetical protein